jgi:MYXO-CTERM domain-containing protein
MRILHAPLLIGLAVLFPLVTPSQAKACGGTFCDNTGIPMPVDQRGEDILFVQDGPDIEVHVRIEYEGEAERFAWLVPVQAVPEISVGSEVMFVRVAEATAPRWIRNSSDECPDEGWETSGGFVPEDDLAGASEPDVVLEETVGAFEVVVLQGGTAAEVINFLDQNGYAQDPAATPILQEYLDEGFLFAAVKLSANASVDAIHPLVFRFPGNEPCVPIRLTRIAAEQDMGIRAYFLGQERWAPQNYKHVVLNPLAYPWSEVGWGASTIQYTELLTLAVDEAGGRAFATDFAGDSAEVVQFGIYYESWDESVFVGLNMIEALDQVAIQQLNIHPLIQPLLLEFMPPPNGIDPQQFWNNIEAYEGLIDIETWDSAGFAAAVSERIIEPALHAVDLLETWPYLTRLHTTMSPHEMTVDPMFQPAPMLGDVSNSVAAKHIDLCGDTNGDRYLVPFGDQQLPVCLAELVSEWPAELRERAALRIETIPPMGPPQVLEDFSAQILSGHATYQADRSCELGIDGEDTGDEGEADSGGPTDGGDEGDTGGASSSEAGGKIGCACRSDERQSPVGALWGLLGLASLVVGRRRQRPRV